MSNEPTGKNPGEFLNQATAVQELDAFFKYREQHINEGTPWNPASSFYAYQFGLENMNQLLLNINKWNDAQTDPNQKLGGVRVFSAINTASSEGGADVFLIPYYEISNKDFIPVDKYFDNGGKQIEDTDEDDGGMILGNGKRCPPHCSEG